MRLNVKQLIDKLKTCDQTAAVMVIKSNGGNTYLADVRFAENKVVNRSVGDTAVEVGRAILPNDENVIVIS